MVTVNHFQLGNTPGGVCSPCSKTHANGFEKIKSTRWPKKFNKGKSCSKILYTQITAAGAVVAFNDRVSSLEKVLANVGIKLGHLTMMAL